MRNICGLPKTWDDGHKYAKQVEKNYPIMDHKTEKMIKKLTSERKKGLKEKIADRFENSLLGVLWIEWRRRNLLI